MARGSEYAIDDAAVPGPGGWRHVFNPPPGDEGRLERFPGVPQWFPIDPVGMPHALVMFGKITATGASEDAALAALDALERTYRALCSDAVEHEVTVWGYVYANCKLRGFEPRGEIEVNPPAGSPAVHTVGRLVRFIWVRTINSDPTAES